MISRKPVQQFAGCVLFAAALLMINVSTVLGQSAELLDEEVRTPGLDVEVAAGWDGTADVSTAVSISALFNNVSRESVEGWVVLSDPWGNRETVIEEVYLAAGQKRRFSTIQSFSSWNRCVFSIRRRDGEVIFRTDLPISRGGSTYEGFSTALIVNDSTVTLNVVDTGVKFDDAQTEQPQNRGRYIAPQFQPHVSPRVGRPVRSLNVKTWQLPNHPAPLQRAAAIVFPDGVELLNINSGQWRALARYVCKGGNIFISPDMADVADELTTRSPLLPDPAIRIASFDVQRMGLGKIYTTSGSLFDGSPTADRAVSEEISRLTTDTPIDDLQLNYRYNRESGRADMNRLLVGSFFGLYAVLSGVGTLVIFRRPRRQVLTYVTAVVAGACVVAVGLGGTMRLSRGDVHWASIIKGGAGGTVEFGKLEVQSAGNRNSRLRINGPNPDLQVISRTRRYYYPNDDGQQNPPFTWQPSQTKDDADAYEVQFPITPWGLRKLRAVSYKSGIRTADAELTKQGNDWHFSMTNHLPFTLQNCTLYVSVVDENGDVWRTSQPLQNVGIDESRTAKFAQNAKHMHGNFRMPSSTATVTPQWIQRKRTIYAWITAQVFEPAQMNVSADSEFVSADSSHFYIQDLLPEQIHSSGSAR